MLVQLVITDFAIIRHLDLSLHEGLNILSGETGAGKSIIINAINLLLGGRSSADLIRTGCSEAVVEGLFSLQDAPGLANEMSDAGLSFDGELLIKRTISREGRNRVFINGSLATLQTLASLGPRLISISGQYAHQLLLKPENHLDLLDDFSGLEAERLAVAKRFEKRQSLKKDVAARETEIKAQREREELTRFQIGEIEMAGLVPGEDRDLEEEKLRLQHAEELFEIASSSYQRLYESHDSVLSSVALCARALEKGAAIAPELSAVRSSLADVEAQIEDVSFTLRDFQKSIQSNPDRLNQVADRLDQLNKLKRKYGGTLEDILGLKDELLSRVTHLEEKDAELAQLRQKLAEMDSSLLNEAAELSRKRRESSLDFREAVIKELRQLHMKDTQFDIRFEETVNPGIEDVRPDGIDRLEFVISPNPGEALRPLSKIASGGELSRILLAIRTIISRTASVETVVFDEVDAGISGATADVVGHKMASLAAYHQIVCITHLPQIASQGSTHFVVRKQVLDGRTEAAISELKQEERVGEIARLVGGREITPQALAHAREMLDRH